MDYALNFPEQLSLHLKSLRKAAGLSQARLAQLLGVTQSRVAAIEKDPATVSLGQFMEILQLLGAELVMRTQVAHPQRMTSHSTPPPAQTPRPVATKKARLPATDMGPFKPQTLPSGWQNKKPKGTW